MGDIFVSHSVIEGKVNVLEDALTKKSERRGLIYESPTAPIFITLVSVYILFSIFLPQFRTFRTLSGIFNAASVSAIVVMAVTLLMIAGEFDLSVGAIIAMGGYIFAFNILGGRSAIVAILLTLLVTSVMGCINGLVTIGTSIPSFIVTLGTQYIFRAAVWIYSGGLLVQTTERLPVMNIFGGRLELINNLIDGANFRYSILWVILAAIIFQFLLGSSKFGNHIYATGGNPEAAKAQGVKTKLIKLICFSLTGFMSGFAGILLFSEHTSVFVSTATGVEFTVIAGAVIGGTLLTGGYGSVIGGILGIILVNVLRSGVIMFGFPSDNFPAIVGLTIIGAVILNDKIRGFLVR